MFEIIRDEINKVSRDRIQVRLTQRSGGIAWDVDVNDQAVAGGFAPSAQQAILTIDAVRRLWGAA